MQDENGEYVWRTIRGARVKIYKNKSLTESFNLQKQNADKYKDGKLELKEKFYGGGYINGKEETYYKLANGKKIKFIDKKEYKDMTDRFYDKLTQDEKDAISIWVNDPYIFTSPIYKLKKDYATILDNLFKDKAETLQQDTLLFRRTGIDYLDIKNGITTDYNVSTSAYDVLPKTMPSGIRFGDKEMYIIAPKGTKVLPIEKVAVNDVADDVGEKRIFARQHEFILSKGTNLELVQDLSTYETGWWEHENEVDEKYVVKLTDKKYKKAQYEKPEYYGTENGYERYIYKKGKKEILIEEQHKGERSKKLSRSEAIKYKVFDLAMKGKPEYYDTYDEAIEAIEKYL